MAYQFGQASQNKKQAEIKPVVEEKILPKKQYQFGMASQNKNVSPEIVPEEKPVKKDSFIKSLVKTPVESLLIKPAIRTGQAIAAGATYAFGSEESKKRADEMLAKDVEVNLGPLGKYNIEAVKTGKAGIKQAFGESLEAGSYLVGGGAAPAAIKSTLGKAVATGVKAGVAGGGMYGTGEALQEDKNLPEVLKQGATGAVIGGVLGAAVPVAVAGVGKVAGGVKNVVANKIAKQVEEKALLTGNVPDARIAKKMISESGKIVKDTTAQEAIRQGIPEADVALIKVSSPSDKIKMAKMLDIRKNQLTNKRVTDRATDVVGDTFVEKLAKPIEKLNRNAAKKLDQVAQSLAGKKVSISPATKNFADNLDRAGIKINKKGGLNFKDSDFEGIPTAQKAITDIYNRVVKVIKHGDAHQIHRIKRFIDEKVSYGKAAEGLSGRAENILKQLRHDIDAVLDSKFSSYNRVNTQFADTIKELNSVGEVLGKSFKLGDTFTDAKAGLAMRRILSNTQSRSEILKMLDSMQKVAKKYRIKIDEDIITQANFADVLEKMLGTEAPTSMLGQVERGLQGLGGAGADIMRGKVISGTLKAGKYLIDTTRGVNQENSINALKELLKATKELPIKKTGAFFPK